MIAAASSVPIKEDLLMSRTGRTLGFAKYRFEIGDLRFSKYGSASSPLSYGQTDGQAARHTLRARCIRSTDAAVINIETKSPQAHRQNCGGFLMGFGDAVGWWVPQWMARIPCEHWPQLVPTSGPRSMASTTPITCDITSPFVQHTLRKITENVDAAFATATGADSTSRVFVTRRGKGN